MASLFSRSILSPLKLCPESVSKIQLLLSPSLSGSRNANNNTPLTDNSTPDSTPTAPFLPSSLLPDIIQQCPSLSGKNATYTPSPHLPSGHMQTIYSAGVNTVEEDVVHYKRRVLLLPDGGIISLDIAEEQGNEGKDGVGTVVICHGLTGGSQESYVRHCVKRLRDGPGYRCIVVNFRGCANTPVTSAQLYSAAKTSDLRCALLFITSIYPHSPLIGLSFSLGANVLAKYLGEEGDDSPLLAGIACAAPFHLKKGSDLLEQSAVRRTVYSRAMNANLTRVTRRHAATLDLDVNLRDAIDDLLDPKRAQARVQLRGDKVAKSKDTLKYVDDTVVRLLGGHRKPYGEFTFESADDYYRNGGALTTLHGLKRPLLALNADDDPIVASEGVTGLKHLMGWHDEKEEEEYGHTDYIILATTQGGGHLGWWEQYKKPTRWIHLPVIDFAKAVIEQSGRLLGDRGQTTETTYDNHSRVSKEVLIELMPSSLLPSYIEVKDRREDAAASPQEVNREDKQYERGPRLPWLRTHLLDQAPLLHPSMSRHGWCGQEPASKDDFRMDRKGVVVDDESGKSKGWCAFKAEMTCDGTRPEVGYLELPAWTRVAGAGEYFQGGKDTPGLYGDEREKGDGTIAGL
ncbi:hypothetical protein CBS101457_002812 [Exobasidium rhododendri]|nr:hypothetical protein CBS101457_002812 [Exobasidium rhododendri]